MRILSTELRLRVKNRKPRPFMRAASADATVGDSRCSVNQAFDDADGGGAGGSFSRDSAISSPSTPNSSLSSQSNLVCGGGTPSPNTPSPATPTSQQSANTPLSGNSAIYQTPGSGFGVSPSGHKNSLKGTKLARRARSFKDDLIEKISMIRTPNNTLGRSHSPHSPRSKPMKPPPTAEEVAKSASSLEMHVKDISNALKHFCDVILKSKLEVLPGNATVILETIASMYTVIQSYALDKHSTVLLSATQQVYQSLGKLVKLCDEVMLIYAARRSDDEGGEDQAQDEHQQLKALLSEENVKEIVDLLGDAVRNLATLAQQKLKEREENAFKYAPSNADAAATANNAAVSHNNLMRLPVEVAGQRTSLPDITLTPKERDILEKTNSNPIRASHSTESILRDTSPPPKPPLPNRPPPLPPKRRSQQQQQQNSHNKSINSDLDWSSDISLGNYGVDYNLSVRSHSPDENSSQCSLDSELNHSREEEELKSLVLANRLNEFKPLISGGKRAALNNKVAGNKTVGTIGGGGVSSEPTNTQAQSVVLEDSKRAAGTGDDVDECDFTQAGNVNSGAGGAMDKLEMRKNINNRHSNESGFVSMTSVRTSAQSVSKRSSDCGFQSSTKSSSNSEIAFDAVESSSSGEFHTQTQEFHQQTTCLSMTNTISSTMMTTSNSIMNNMSTLAHDARSISNTSSVSPDHYESGGLVTERSVHTTSSASHVQSSFSSLVKANSLDTTSSSDGGMGSHSDLVPPALPPKTSRSKDARIFSQYDNFDEIEDNNSELAELRPHHHYNSNSYSQHNQHALQQHHNHHHQYQHHVSQWQQTKHQSLIDSRRLGGGFVSSCTTMGSIGVDISSSGGGGGTAEQPPPLPIKKKHSFVSMTSVRTSAQSVSKRSSDCGFQSSTKSSSNSEIAFDAIESSSSGEFHTQTQEFHQQTTCLSMTNTISSTMMTTSNSIMNNMSTLAHDARSISNTSSVSPDHYESGGLVTERSVHTTSSASHVQSSFSSLVKANSLDTTSSSDGGMGSHSDLVPPALPPKTSRSKDARIFSQYDNFDEIEDNNSELAELRPHHHYNSNSYSQHNQHALQQHHNHHHQYQHHVSQWQQTKHQSLIDSRRLGGGFVSSCTTMGSIGVDISSSGGGGGTAEQPPPLPIKKKHIWAYMELCQGPNRPLGRHTMHMYDLTGNISHSQTMNIVPLPKDLSPPSEQEMPPALPPKNYKQQRKSSATPPTIITTPPPSPKPAHLSASADAENGRPARVLSATQGSEMMSTVCEELSDLTEEEQASLRHSHQLPNENCSSHMSRRHSPLRRADTHEGTHGCRSESAGEDQLLEHSNFGDDKCGELQTVSQEELPKMLEEIDVTKYLVLKRKDEDGPEVKGGYVDALIVHASRVQNDNAFIDAFITTFRTFIQPIDVIEKLTHRYTIFFCCQNDQKQRVARETFSLLMRVVDGLTSMDLTDQLLSLIVEFNYQLVCAGQLYLAKTLRSIFVEKVTLFREQRLPPPKADMHITVTNQPSLLDLKSVEIAEQMTLLDADLFQKIEIPEVLLFAKEQSEEKSPNLNKFTEHFNNMSFWARSKILTLCDAKEREKHVIKFIKIMKHLRKMNNYNSYLALLSALDSAPIRRLEWHKTITQDIKEYCLLIDSSSSFRAYRTTLAATSPPCIPYIGLVLQDLTFVHVGNPDYLKEGVVNFSKRWQQYHLIENMKRFKKCEYNFKRNERIIRFFDNFEYELGEEEMWQISESIKPRGRRPVQA